MIHLLARTPLVGLLWREPALELTREQRAAFERGGCERYPRHEYLRWLVAARAVLLHGTADASIDVFEPREQTDWDGRRVRAVFATSDGIWPIFFAVVNRQVVIRVRASARGLRAAPPRNRVDVAEARAADRADRGYPRRLSRSGARAQARPPGARPRDDLARRAPALTLALVVGRA